MFSFPYKHTIRPLMFRYIIFFLICPLLSMGQIPSPKADSYVNDYTQTLNREEIRQLNEQLLSLEKQTSVQMAILLIDNLPENLTIVDYARSVGNTWKVGNHYNGLVYVAVLKERKQRLEVARNLEGDIPDITAFTIIESLKPYLRQKQYYEALQTLISSVSLKLGSENATLLDTGKALVPEAETLDTPSPEESERALFEREKAKYDRIGDYAIVGIIIGLIIFCVYAWRYKKKYRKEHTENGVYTGIGSAYFTATYGGDADGSDDGNGGFGGFGGGGGGGFSGGGASGSW